MLPYSVRRLEGPDSNPSCPWVRGTEDLLSSRYQKDTSLQDPRLLSFIQHYWKPIMSYSCPQLGPFHLQILNFLLIYFSLSQLFILMKSKTSFFSIKVAVSPSQPSFAPYNASFSRNISLHLHLSKMKHGVSFLLWTVWPKLHQIQTCWCLETRLHEIFVCFFARMGGLRRAVIVYKRNISSTWSLLLDCPIHHTQWWHNHLWDHWGACK